VVKLSSVPHYLIPIQTKLDDLRCISQSQHIRVFISSSDFDPDYREAFSCMQVLLQVNYSEFYLVTAEQTEIAYKAEIDHLLIVKEKEMPKLQSFNPKEKPEFIQMKEMQSQNGFQLITFLEEDYYCKTNSNELDFTFEAGTALLLANDDEKLLISLGNTPYVLIITSNIEDIDKILLKKGLKPYTLEIKPVI
jgi:hypothetical protein